MITLPDVVITGPPVVGKGTICKVLRELGYSSIIDTGKRVRQELAELGEDAPERNRQGEYGSEMIRAHGGGYFVDRMLQDLPGPHIINGPRRAVEIDYMLGRGAIVVFVNADESRRHVWSCVRNTERDGLSYQEFLAKDMLEWGYVPDMNGSYRRHNNPYERNLHYALGKAHVTFDNSGTREELQNMTRSFVDDLHNELVGPNGTWQQRTYRSKMVFSHRL